MFYPIKGELDLTNQHVINFAKNHQFMYVGKIKKGMTRVFTYMMAVPEIVNPITILLSSNNTLQKIHPGGARLMAAYTRGFKTLNCVALSTKYIDTDKIEIIKNCSRNIENLQMIWSAWNYDWFSICDPGQLDYMDKAGSKNWVDETTSWFNKNIHKPYGTLNWYNNGRHILTIPAEKNKKVTDIHFTTDQGFFNSLMYIGTGTTHFEPEFTLDRIQ